ncbi:MAG: acetate--CoA ligase [Deltaproteobacteria bacterium]|nr:acetate--CoA ligase [Deltaproteobacteria bacterium]
MSETYAVPTRVTQGSRGPIPSAEAYRETWLRAAANPDRFWLQIARERVVWRTAPTIGLEGGYREVRERPFTWFADGTLNVTETCLDQHLATRGDKTAILWEGDRPGETRTLTYLQLHAEVNRLANTLVSLGVRPDDRVILYMGMVPELAVAMLACARVGAIHSIVFGGFSAEALRDRVLDSGARVVLTQDEGPRGTKRVPLKATVDAGIEGLDVERVLVYRRTGGEVPWVAGRDLWWHEQVSSASPEFTAVERGAEDPLFILYTSGSTGKPKGVVHTSGGYLTYASYTHQVVFDVREDDVYACVADIGWITGHTYIVYGPLANGATTFMFESVPTYPDAGRYWDMVERHGISVFYTAPTAIRAIAAHGDDLVKRYDRSSLRVLGTVGEPINPDAWRWYYEVVGEGRCTIVDTWWQTETGGILIAPLAPATPTKPGSATLPLPGILPALVNQEGELQVGPSSGYLVITHPWPGQARTVFGDHERYVSTYFSNYEGLYFTGDGARRDGDGYYWITGRVDDVLNISGHRLGTAELESALLTVDSVAEVAVVGYPHQVKGQGVYAYVVLQPGFEASALVEEALNGAVRSIIGPFARVDLFQFVPGLPKTRSGKVMRRILRKVAEGEAEALGDLSTLADPSVVEVIKCGAKV